MQLQLNTKNYKKKRKKNSHRPYILAYISFHMVMFQDMHILFLCRCLWLGELVEDIRTAHIRHRQREKLQNQRLRSVPGPFGHNDRTNIQARPIPISHMAQESDLFPGPSAQPEIMKDHNLLQVQSQELIPH